MSDPIEEAVGVLGEAMAQSIEYARASERLAGALGTLTELMRNIGGIAELAPDTAPELRAALDAGNECAEALGRAQSFLRAKLEVNLQGLRRRLDDD